MSQSPNAPASRPAAPAPRPDLQALLLAAVRQRQSQEASRLVQQWVHRRGVGSLEHFQLEILAPREGTEAFDWLCQLIDDGPLALPPAVPVTGPAAALPPAAPEPSPLSSVAEPSPLATTIVAGPADRQAVDPAARAIAAVDAAFDALAAEFPQFRLPDSAEPLVEAGGSEAVTAVDVHLESAVAPAVPEAATHLTTEGLDPELLVVDIDLDEPPAVLEEPPADLFDDPILFPPAASDPLAARRFSFEIPQPPAEPPLAPAVATEATGDPLAEASAELSTEAIDEPSSEAAALDAAQDAPLARLRHRLRRGLSLSRVRTLMRDCLDEAVASLNPPQAGPLDAGMVAGSAEDFAVHDGVVASPSASPSPASSSASPLPLAEGSALAPGLATVEPSRLPAPVPSTSLQPTAPAPAFALATTPGAPELGQDVAAPLSPAAQLRERLRARRVETRPAPAPASLSDLRAWLPSVDDLPRAS